LVGLVCTTNFIFATGSFDEVTNEKLYTATHARRQIPADWEYGITDAVERFSEVVSSIHQEFSMTGAEEVTFVFI
jgi:hypothetical protein